MAHVLFSSGFPEDRELRSRIRRALATAGARVRIGSGEPPAEGFQVLLAHAKKAPPSDWAYQGPDGTGFHLYESACSSHDFHEIVNRVREIIASA
jgi:hypothetical protein